MDGGIVGGIVTIAVAIAGGPHLWRWLVERRRLALEAQRAAQQAQQTERTKVDEAEARLLTRLEARVSHLEEENAKLHAENRELTQRLDAKTREVDGVRAAYALISEQHAILVGRVKALETTIETLNAANAKSLERAIAAALAKRDSQT